MPLLATFSFFIFLKSISFIYSPRRLFLLVACSSSSLGPPRRSFLHFEDPKHCLNHVESVKIPFFTEFDESRHIT